MRDVRNSNADFVANPTALEGRPQIHLVETEPDRGPDDLFRELSWDERDELFAAGDLRAFSAGETIFEQGALFDGIAVLLSGRVRSLHDGGSNRSMTLAYWQAGHFIGAPQALGGGEQLWTSVAVDDTRCLMISGAATERLIRRSPNLTTAIVEGLVQKNRLFSALVKIMGMDTTPARLAQLFLALARPSREIADAYVVADAMSHEELGHIVGDAAAVVSAAMAQFEADALLKRAEDDAFVIDRPGLRRLCA